MGCQLEISICGSKKDFSKSLVSPIKRPKKWCVVFPSQKCPAKVQMRGNVFQWRIFILLKKCYNGVSMTHLPMQRKEENSVALLDVQCRAVTTYRSNQSREVVLRK